MRASRVTKVDLESSKTMLAKGPHALHGYVANTMEAAIGRELPQMEVRYNNLSITADVAVIGDVSAKSELPTIYNVTKRNLAKLAPNKRMEKKHILKNASGMFKPGTITLVLGQPGSGKSSLMRVLAGQFPSSKNVTIEDDILYNGREQKDFAKQLPQFAAYVTQEDKHFPSLTVRETLEFAHEFCGGGLSKFGEDLLTNGTPEENLAALEAAKAYFHHYPDLIIDQLGLQNCQNTIIGNAMRRGVSGGERKRVTTGEMEFGMKYMTLMDEISTGLDSAATYDIIKTQRSIAKKLHKTVCPPGRDVADFLLDLGTNQQGKYEAALPRNLLKHPRKASEFAELFRQSSVYSNLVALLDDPFHPHCLEDAGKHMEPMPEFRQSFWENTKTLTRRQWVVTIRNHAFIRTRALMVVVMGLIYGSTFYQADPVDVQRRLGVTFQATIFMALGQTSQVPTFMAARDIFYKQRAANFARASSYAIANSVALVPQAIFESVLFGSLVYWLGGFVVHAGHYLIFVALLVLTNLVFASWFFCLTAISPNFNIAKPMSTFTIAVFVLFGGFVASRQVIPDWLIWLYWLNPMAWCLRALDVNEYRAAKYDVCVFEGVDYCSKFNATMGEYFLSEYSVPSSSVWVWTGVIYLIGAYLLFMALGAFVLEYKRYDGPRNVVLTPTDVEQSSSTEPSNDYALVSTPKNSSTSPGSSCQEDVAVNVHTREKNFVPVTLAFEDLWYSVPKPSNPKESIDLLKGISGIAEPGTLTALMGSSGAGKTTLMDVIAGRKTGGKITGKIMLNGYEANELAIRRCTAYCEQMDIHSDATTFREAFTFSAFLRQDSSVPDSKKYDTVDEVLDLLDMHDIGGQIVRGSSMEQMKRLTIGVELAAQPSVLFLDEPTSGLDAHSSKLIMDGVRKVADSGRTIVCTIHQPSSDVFFLFDHLLFLKRGGETVFVGELGEKSQNLVRYLEAIPGTPLNQNPATWMLEVIGAGVSNTVTTDFVQQFKNSAEKRSLDAALDRPGVNHPAPGVPEMVFTKKRAASSMTQLRFLMKRFNDRYWRTPSYNITRVAISLMLAIVFGFVFMGKDYKTYQEVNSGVGMIFTTTLFNGVISFTGTLPITSAERPAFYRERASQTYNCLWYFVGSTVAELPYVFFSGGIFTIIFYPWVGFTNHASGIMYWVTMSLFVLMQTYLGHLFIYALPSVEVAAILGVLYNSICLLFAGFNPPAASIPAGYHWLYLITPQKYIMGLLSSLAFTDCSNEPVWNSTLGAYEHGGSEPACQQLEDAPVTLGHTTVKGYVEDHFRMKHSEIWSNFGYVFVFLAVFRLLHQVRIKADSLPSLKSDPELKSEPHRRNGRSDLGR
ncbi:unnamed protein product [Phytophthora lilii]|uniref:Unnamed protein product n=1 Tax=Phytophthora lilii TaxID=2077276 RepID=A0A9W6UD52_9STRA|nr:unnamed protein product [Phytophthora lilii]